MISRCGYLGEVISSGRIFPILGGLFLPEKISSLDWTPEVAEETAAFLKKVSDPEDKAQIQRQVISLLISFFQSGLASLTISRKSSGTGPQRSARFRERGSVDFGDWGLMVRELAGWDPEQAKTIIRWPLREALLATWPD